MTLKTTLVITERLQVFQRSIFDVCYGELCRNNWTDRVGSWHNRATLRWAAPQNDGMCPTILLSTAVLSLVRRCTAVKRAIAWVVVDNSNRPTSFTALSDRHYRRRECPV